MPATADVEAGGVERAVLVRQAGAAAGQRRELRPPQQVGEHERERERDEREVDALDARRRERHEHADDERDRRTRRRT
jgi:hypothetical protein